MTEQSNYEKAQELLEKSDEAATAFAMLAVVDKVHELIELLYRMEADAVIRMQR